MKINFCYIIWLLINMTSPQVSGSYQVCFCSSSGLFWLAVLSEVRLGQQVLIPFSWSVYPVCVVQGFVSFLLPCFAVDHLYLSYDQYLMSEEDTPISDGNQPLMQEGQDINMNVSTLPLLSWVSVFLFSPVTALCRSQTQMRPETSCSLSGLCGSSAMPFLQRWRTRWRKL